MAKPTSAVVNIVWAMRYPVADTSGGGGLSTAAKAGIGAGAGVLVILLLGLAICLWRRKNKKAADGQKPVPPVQSPPQQQPPMQQPQMIQHAPVPIGQYPPAGYPPAGFAPGMLAPGMMPPPSDHASIMSSATPVSAAALVPQNTGTSAAVSELSSQSGQNLLHNGHPSGAFAGVAASNPRVSYSSSSGTGSPAVGGNGQVYPAPIAEADEGHYPQYAYQQHPQQYPPQQYPPQQQQQPYYPAPGQDQGQYYQAPPPAQGEHAYAQHQQHQYPQQGVPEMSANREAEPPQEVMGSQVQQHGKQQ